MSYLYRVNSYTKSSIRSTKLGTVDALARSRSIHHNNFVTPVILLDTHIYFLTYLF